MSRVLVTGGSGFVGRSLLQRFSDLGYELTSTYFKQAPASAVESIEWCNVGSIDSRTDWRDALNGVDRVVHLAGLAHAGERPYREIQEVNTRGTLRLANAAAKSGVKQFVFVSTAHVHGAKTHDVAFTEQSSFDPVDLYAQSKAEAEEGLRTITGETELSLTIVRPPLVYGAHAKGNFRRLVDLVSRGIPLPFAGISNRRSIVSVDNLTQVLERCLSCDRAKGEAFLVADDTPVSTPELLGYIAEGLNMRSRLWHFPPALMLACARLTGQLSTLEKLSESLEVDSTKARCLLGWRSGTTTRTSVIAAVRAMHARTEV